MLGTYGAVLARPGALRFSAAGLLARLPMSMCGIGIVLMVSTLYDSYALAGRVSAVYVIAQALCSPQLARWVDRRGQARVMRPAIVVSALGLVELVGVALVGAHPAWLYVGAVVSGATVGSFGSLVRARWSAVLGTDAHAVHTAYSLESALDEVVFVVGPTAATLLATSITPSAGLVVPLVALVVGGLWFLSQHATEPVPASRDAPRGRGSVMRSRGMLVLAFVFVAMGAIFGANDVSAVAFADERGHKPLAGALLAICALGSLISGLLYGARQWVIPLWKRFAIGMVGLAIGSSLFVLAHTMWVLAIVMFVSGFAIAPTLINGNGLVQYFVPRARLTEGLTWVGTALGIGVSVGSSLAGAQIDARGSHGGYLVVVSAGALAVVATLVSIRALRAGSLPVETVAEPAARTGEQRVERLPTSSTGGSAVVAAELADCVDPRTARGDEQHPGHRDQ